MSFYDFNLLLQTPVSVFGMAGKYASALYSAGVKAKEIEKVEADFNKFEGYFKQDKRFAQIIKDPTIKKSLKSTMLKEAAAKMSFSKTSSNALALLAENGRLKNFVQINTLFKLVMAAHRGEISCEVVSAKVS